MYLTTLVGGLTDFCELESSQRDKERREGEEEKLLHFSRAVQNHCCDRSF